MLRSHMYLSPRGVGILFLLMESDSSEALTRLSDEPLDIFSLLS